MDVEEQRIALALFVGGGIGEQAFDFEAVFRFPAHDLSAAERQLRQVRVDLADGDRLEALDRADARFGGPVERLPAEAEVRARGVEMDAGGDAAGPRFVDAEQGGRAIEIHAGDAGHGAEHFGVEETLAVGGPTDEFREPAPPVVCDVERARLAAGGGDDMDAAAATPGRRIVAGDIGDPLAVGRKQRREFRGAGGLDERFGIGLGRAHNSQPRRAPVIRSRRACAGIHERIAIGRPIVAGATRAGHADARRRPGVRRFLGLFGIRAHDVDPADRNVFVHHARVVLVFLTGLLLGWGRVESRVGDAIADGKPLEAGDGRGHIGDAHAGAEFGRHDVKVAFAGARRDEGDPLAVRRPLGIVARFVAVRQLKGARAVGVDEVNVRPILALAGLRDRLLHGVEDALAVGRHLHAADAFDLHQLHRRPFRGLLRLGGERTGDGEDRFHGSCVPCDTYCGRRGLAPPCAPPGQARRLAGCCIACILR